jgi:hypothetical protein
MLHRILFGGSLPAGMSLRPRDLRIMSPSIAVMARFTLRLESREALHTLLKDISRCECQAARGRGGGKARCSL